MLQPVASAINLTVYFLSPSVELLQFHFHNCLYVTASMLSELFNFVYVVCPDCCRTWDRKSNLLYHSWIIMLKMFWYLCEVITERLPWRWGTFCFSCYFITPRASKHGKLHFAKTFKGIIATYKIGALFNCLVYYLSQATNPVNEYMEHFRSLKWCVS